MRIDGEHPPDHRVDAVLKRLQGHPQEERICRVNTGVLAIDLCASGILDLNGAIGRLQVLGKVKLYPARRPLECTFNRWLRPLKPTVSKRGADAERPGGKRESEASRACRKSQST
jgi:hypothetical protein